MRFDAALTRLQPLAFLLLRVVMGGMFALHGAQKLLGWPPGGKPPAFGSQMWFGGAIELCAGALIAIGLFTRPAAFLASGTMAVAYVQFHWHPWLADSLWLPLKQGGNGGESALLYCLAFLFVATHGAGAASIDRRRGRS